MQTLFWSIEKHKIKTDFFHSQFVCLLFYRFIFSCKQSNYAYILQIIWTTVQMRKRQTAWGEQLLQFLNPTLRVYACVCDDAYLCWQNDNIRSKQCVLGAPLCNAYRINIFRERMNEIPYRHVVSCCIPFLSLIKMRAHFHFFFNNTIK